MSAHLNPQLLELLEHFRLDRTYVRGEGSWLTDDRGRRVLDLSSQYGALPLGHNPKALWDALENERRLGTPPMVQPSRPLRAIELAERLAKLAPVGEGDGVVTFSQSGAEAVEIAIRLARLATGRTIVVGGERAYHGKTLGASALTWESSKAMREALRPPGFAHVAWDDAAALERFLDAHQGEVAAVLLEPIQGEGGVREPGPGYFERVRELCTKRGVLLILDEVQTGLGRTGTLFCAEQLGVRPDILVLSKALGGGLVPLAATIAAPHVWTEEFALSHGSTFANNNLSCAVGLAVLDALEGGLVERGRERSRELRAGFDELARRYKGVFRAIRGRGLLLGLELEPVGPESSFFMQHLFASDAVNGVVASYLLNEHGVRVIPCLTHGRALRVQPSLDVTRHELAQGLAAFEALAKTIHRRDWSCLVAPFLAGEKTGRRPVDARPLERPVIASRPLVEGEEPSRFAFLIHHTAPEDQVGTTRAFGRLPSAELRSLYEWTARFPGHSPLCHMPSIRGKGRAVAEGWLLGLTHTPESMRARPRAEVSAEIGKAVLAAQKLGAHVVGLGAFTSIMTQNGAEVPSQGSAITTGSALTVAVAVDGVKLACERLGVDQSTKRGLVLGLGVVGSAAAVVASESLGSLVLVGNPLRPERERAKASALMDRIYARAIAQLDDPDARGIAAELRRVLPLLGARFFEAVARGEPATGLADEVVSAFRSLGMRAPVELAPRLEAAIGEADVIIAATSAAKPLIGPDDLRPGAIVCDVAKPADVARTVAGIRDDVLVFDGGLVRYPEPIAFGQNLGYEPGVNLACLTETIVLALEGVRGGRFGVGLASDLVDEVPRIREAARRHGFSVAELRVNGRVLPEQHFGKVREAAARRRAAESRRLRKPSLPLSA
ncbi:MAG TPA: aminotransferase class III-fold pyridoxal phosphate-dependent enzyme [Planctomycetota bacterium]|nr:aminotransferase class III-fold pyridoxal phosphate-dependent enzyme [Planctomycetota bacterium]